MDYPWIINGHPLIINGNQLIIHGYPWIIHGYLCLVIRRPPFRGCHQAARRRCLPVICSSLAELRVCSVRADKLISPAQTNVLSLQTRILLFSGVIPAQPRPLIPFRFLTENETLKKNTTNYERCAQMLPKCHQNVCNNCTLSRATPKM